MTLDETDHGCAKARHLEAKVVDLSKKLDRLEKAIERLTRELGQEAVTRQDEYQSVRQDAHDMLETLERISESLTNEARMADSTDLKIPIPAGWAT